MLFFFGTIRYHNSHTVRTENMEMEETEMKIGDNIRLLRLESGFSQEELGVRLGVSRQAVSKWEGGMTAPDISLLPQLAEALGVSIDALFSGTDAHGHAAYGSYRQKLAAITSGRAATEEDFRRGIEAYAEIIMTGSAPAADYAEYGRLMFRRARYDLAVAERYFRRAIAEGDACRDIQWLGAHKSLMHLRAMTGGMEEALKEAQEWTEREPDCCWAHSHLALVLDSMGKAEEAYEKVVRALEIEPDDMDALTCAGDICRKLMRYDEAIRFWDRAYEADCSSISCWFSKAEAYAEIGEGEKAIRQYEQILAWLEEKGYDMRLEGAYPMKRIEELRRNNCRLSEKTTDG